MARRKKRPDPDELDAQATAIIEHADTLAQNGADLRSPSNDPHYLEALQARDKTREFIANKVDTVHIVPDGRKTWIGIGLTNPRSKADAMETARLMGEHFEAKVIRHE